jgi:hypothetical protein
MWFSTGQLLEDMDPSSESNPFTIGKPDRLFLLLYERINFKVFARIIDEMIILISTEYFNNINLSFKAGKNLFCEGGMRLIMKKSWKQGTQENSHYLFIPIDG